jgi:retron-type reverse transcriptase
MKAYGLTGNLIKWLKSYLIARRQKVVIKNNSSAYCEISAGVPQGSVLHPLLFIIYINDIAGKLISLSRLFADDTSFGYSNRDIMQLKNVIAHDLNEMDIWSPVEVVPVFVNFQSHSYPIVHMHIQKVV